MSKAIAQFVRIMISADSKFDQWRRGEVELTESEYNGYQMFLREGGDPEVVPGGQFGADCFHCHGEAGLQFTDHLFHNNGLDPSFEADPGRVLVTGTPWIQDVSAPPPCATWPCRRPTCTTDGFPPWKRSSSTTTPAGFRLRPIDPFMKYAAG